MSKPKGMTWDEYNAIVVAKRNARFERKAEYEAKFGKPIKIIIQRGGLVSIQPDDKPDSK